jgi:predicted nucleic acid-binding protein
MITLLSASAIIMLYQDLLFLEEFERTKIVTYQDFQEFVFSNNTEYYRTN